MGTESHRNPYNILDYIDYEIVGLMIGTFEPIRKPVYFHIEEFIRDNAKQGVQISVGENGEIYGSFKL